MKNQMMNFKIKMVVYHQQIIIVFYLFTWILFVIPFILNKLAQYNLEQDFPSNYIKHIKQIYLLQNIMFTQLLKIVLLYLHKNFQKIVCRF